MRRRRLITGMSALAVAPRPARAAEATDARLVAMTFNIRLDLVSDGPNAWPLRRELVASLLRFHGVDVLGVQEALAHQVRHLAEDLPGHAWVGAGREDGREAGEFSAVFYRRERFEPGASGTFWLSPTPEVAGRRGWDAAFPRVATWVELRERRSGRAFLVVNTHFDHRGEQARAESAALLVSWLKQRSPERPALLLGDFNCAPGSAPYRTLTAPGALVDAIETSPLGHHGPTFTFQGFDFTTRTGEAIDHVLLRPSPSWSVLRHGTLADHRDGRCPSDHYPVLVELALRAG